MSQVKVLAFHVEGNTRAELRKNIQAALVDAEINIAGKDEKSVSTKATKGDDDEAPAKAGKKAKKAAEVTLEQVKEALTALRDSSAGAKAVKKIFTKFGVKKTDDLDEDVYADVLTAAEKAMPEDEDEEDEDEEDEDEEDEDED